MTSEVGQAGKRLRERMKVKGGIVDCGFLFLADLEMVWELFFLITDGGNLLDLFIARYYFLTALGKRQGYSDPVADPEFPVGSQAYHLAKFLLTF